MAYFTQEMKKAKSPAIKSICKKYGMVCTLGVKDNATFVVNIQRGVIDFFKGAEPDYSTINKYHYNKYYDGVALEFLTELMDVIEDGNYNNSDVQSDYFDVGFYTTVNIGRWDKPYVVVNN